MAAPGRNGTNPTRGAQTRRMPLRLLHWGMLSLFLATDHQPHDLGRLRLDTLVFGARSDGDLRA